MAQTRSAAKADKHDRYQSKYRSSLPDSLVQRSQRNHRSTTPRDNKTKSKGNFIQRFFGFIVSLCVNYVEYDCQLNHSQLVRMGEHVYSAIDSSWLDQLCMSKFWNYLVEWYPLWLAPNLITLIGLLINLVTVLILSHFCYSATEQAPSWAYFQAAIGLFLYQSLDATDGKQARRTQSSSPLGELFDHGCDSLTQVFVTLNVCYAMQLGTERHLVLTVMFFSIALFYTAHWSTYCTGQLRFSKFDVTEAQMTVIGILLFTSIVGADIWNIRIFGWQLKIICMLTCLVAAIWQFSGYLNVIFNEGVGKNGSTVADTSVICPLCPLLAVCIPFLMLYCKSTSRIYDQNITLLCLCFGAIGAKATNRLIIAHMSRSELEVWDWIYLSPFIMILNQYYDYIIDEYLLLLIATIYAHISLIIFCVLICKQFCGFLNISCFKIDLQKQKSIKEGQSTSSSNGRRNQNLHID
ncbi:hypothetical protein Mgra_00007428 [Meloidogyne graminicola]|uniref:diacylglycerol cholinephosphotransferase n=1 Tax=Meloidogyne graminicola TaxID=189291 RepID=A0A8S9ZIK0_9BILA|nr:hypothetical protein Mgra_00007428 [Meloidogyne graminicola]